MCIFASGWHSRNKKGTVGIKKASSMISGVGPNDKKTGERNGFFEWEQSILCMEALFIFSFLFFLCVWGVVQTALRLDA